MLRLYGNRAGPPKRDPASTDPRSRGGLEISHINALPGLALNVIAYALFTRIYRRKTIFSIDFDLKMIL